MTSHIYYGEKQLPFLLDILEDHFPLRYRELHIEAGDAGASSVHVCVEGHIHLGVSASSPAARVLIFGLYAYCLAVILDAREQLPKNPTKRRVDRVIREFLEVLGDFDQEVRFLFYRNLDMLGLWLDNYHTKQVQVQKSQDFLPSECYGVLGLPIVAGEA